MSKIYHTIKLLWGKRIEKCGRKVSGLRTSLSMIAEPHYTVPTLIIAPSLRLSAELGVFCVMWRISREAGKESRYRSLSMNRLR